MAYFYYWSPASGTNYFNDGHYLRLGTYESQWEPGSANIADSAGHAEGIYFYTNGDYTLKSTSPGDAYIETGKDVSRTVKSGGYSYTNATGNTTITQNDGDVLIKAEGKIRLKSSHNGTDSDSILIKAKDHDLYFQQAGYAKFVDTYKETTVKGFTHKTNIGIVFKFYLLCNLSNYSHIGLSYKTATFGIKEVSIGATGASLSLNGNTYKAVLGIKFGFTIFATQIVWLHEEYEYYKNELKVYDRKTYTVDFKSKIVNSEGAVLGVRNKAVSADVGTELQC